MKCKFYENKTNLHFSWLLLLLLKDVQILYKIMQVVNLKTNISFNVHILEIENPYATKLRSLNFPFIFLWVSELTFVTQKSTSIIHPNLSNEKIVGLPYQYWKNFLNVHFIYFTNNFKLLENFFTRIFDRHLLTLFTKAKNRPVESKTESPKRSRP